MRIFIVLLLLTLASNIGLAQDTTGTVVILSDKIGPTIDLEERNFYRMFLSFQHFESAVLLQMPDSSYTFKIFIKKDNEPSSTIQWITRTKKEIEQICNLIENYSGIQVETSQTPDSTDKITKSIEINTSLFPAIGIFRFGFFYSGLGLEPSYIIDPAVLSLNIVFSSGMNSKTKQIYPFLTIGYGKIFSYRCNYAPHQSMINIGCGLKGRLKSLGVRLEWILFYDFHKGGYFGPSLGLSYFIKI